METTIWNESDELTFIQQRVHISIRVEKLLLRKDT